MGKKKKNRKVLTQWEIDRALKKAQEKIDKKIEETKDEITQDSTRVMKVLDFYILIKYLGVNPERIADIQKAEDEICEKLTSREMDWEDIYNYLAENDIYCDGIVYENGRFAGYE